VDFERMVRQEKCKPVLSGSNICNLRYANQICIRVASIASAVKFTVIERTGQKLN